MKKIGEKRIYAVKHRVIRDIRVQHCWFENVFRSDLLTTLKLLTELFFKPSEVRKTAKELTRVQR